MELRAKTRLLSLELEIFSYISKKWVQPSIHFLTKRHKDIYQVLVENHLLERAINNRVIREDYSLWTNEQLLKHLQKHYEGCTYKEILLGDFLLAKSLKKHKGLVYLARELNIIKDKNNHKKNIFCPTKFYYPKITKPTKVSREKVKETEKNIPSSILPYSYHCPLPEMERTILSYDSYQLLKKELRNPQPDLRRCTVSQFMSQSFRERIDWAVRQDIFPQESYKWQENMFHGIPNAD